MVMQMGEDEEQEREDEDDPTFEDHQIESNMEFIEHQLAISPNDISCEESKHMPQVNELEERP